jgi:hypothetical protein
MYVINRKNKKEKIAHTDTHAAAGAYIRDRPPVSGDVGRGD